jgi:membrane-bound serine protease (ClpP class)
VLRVLFVPLLTVVLALFVLPSPWGVVLVASVILWEVAEKTFWLRWTRRLPVVVGREALIGKPVTALSAIEPEGRVRLQGESWNAYCSSGARRGEMLEVKGLRGLTLVVGKPGE